jgi:uncharacterized membrane protein YbaN (DUF454 family)
MLGEAKPSLTKLGVVRSNCPMGPFCSLSFHCFVKSSYFLNTCRTTLFQNINMCECWFNLHFTEKLHGRIYIIVTINIPLLLFPTISSNNGNADALDIENEPMVNWRPAKAANRKREWKIVSRHWKFVQGSFVYFVAKKIKVEEEEERWALWASICITTSEVGS